MNETTSQENLWPILEARDASIRHLTARLDAVTRDLQEKEFVIHGLKQVCDERDALIKSLSEQIKSSKA